MRDETKLSDAYLEVKIENKSRKTSIFSVNYLLAI